jgi:dihydrofolate reductase
MRNVILSINVSLDGFADHDVAIADDELHYFYINRLNELDAVLFGRVTCRLFEEFWPLAPVDPQSTASVVDFAYKINAIPKVVFSNTLKTVEWNNTRLVHGSPEEEVTQMKQQPGKGLSVGGIRLAQSLIRAGLIDEYWFLVQPVVRGSGRRPFGGLIQRANLGLAESKTFHSGVVALHYQPQGKRTTM